MTDPDNTEPKYATVSWTIGDVQALFECTDEEADEFLARHASTIQEQIVQFGWEVLENLGQQDDMKFIDLYAKEDD